MRWHPSTWSWWWTGRCRSRRRRTSESWCRCCWSCRKKNRSRPARSVLPHPPRHPRSAVFSSESLDLFSFIVEYERVFIKYRCISCSTWSSRSRGVTALVSKGKTMESSALGGPPLLRQINSAHVLAALRGAGPLSLSDLAGRTGLSRPTVGQVVEQLHGAGLLAYVAPGRDGHVRSGRPARLVRFRSEAAYVVGIDIGRHKAHV